MNNLNSNFHRNSIEEEVDMNASFKSVQDNSLLGEQTHRSTVTNKNNESVNLSTNTPRINPLNKRTLAEPKKRLVDTMGQVNPMTKTLVTRPKD